MKTFQDINGEEWSISLTIGEFIRIDDRLAEENMETTLSAPASVMTTLIDLRRMASFLYIVCEQQAKERGIAPAQFGYLFAGDTISQAKEAFLEEYTNFFPTEAEREKIRTLRSQQVRLAEEMFSEGIALGHESLDSVREVMERELKFAKLKIQKPKENNSESVSTKQ